MQVHDAAIATARPEASAERAFRAALGLVLVVAAALRVGHVLALRELPLFGQLIIDSQLYDAWASRIAAGDWLGGDRPFYMDPLYPYALGGLYAAFGRDLLLVRLLQAGLGVSTCALAGIAGRRLGGRVAGVLAAGIVALYQPLVLEEGEIEKTALGVALLAASLVLALGRRSAAGALAGTCLGLAALTRANLLLLAPVMFGWLLIDRGAPAHAGPERLRRRSLRALAFAAGFALALGPVLLRNHHASGEWVLTTSQLGQNLYTGNNPANWRGAFQPVPFVRPNPTFEEHDFRVAAEVRLGRRLSAAEVSAFWRGEAVRHVLDHPAFAGAVLLRKAALVIADLEVPDGWSVYFLERFSWALRLAPCSFAWLLALAVVGAVAGRRHPGVRLLVILAVTYALTVVAFFVFSRYRIHLVPLLAPLAGIGATALFDAARARAWCRAVALAALAGAVAAASLAAAGAASLDRSSFVHNFGHLAELYARAGDRARAEALLGDAIREQPRAASPHVTLGALRLEAGDSGGAVAALEHAVRLDPRYPSVWFLLGKAQERTGNVAAARAAYFRQLDATPGHGEAMLRLRSLVGSGAAPAPGAGG